MDHPWQELMPSELILEIFKFLNRNDKYQCYHVCRRWRDLVSHAHFWRRFVVLVDKDFFWQDTIILCHRFNQHIRTLEIGWNRQLLEGRWLPMKHGCLTQRMVQYLMNLHDNDVQVNTFKLFNWCQVYAFKKIIYHIARFLKIQRELHRIIFLNFNPRSAESWRILEACAFSKNSITSLEIRNCFYNFNTIFDTEEFALYLLELKCLEELKVDYFILSNQEQMMDIVIHHASENALRNLEITFGEIDVHSNVIPNSKWQAVEEMCPELYVSFVLKNIYTHEQVQFMFFMRSVPLKSLYIMGNSKPQRNVNKPFNRVIKKLVDNHSRTLECITLDLRNSKENLDDILVQILVKCKNLRKFFFEGVLNRDMRVLQQIYQDRGNWKGLQVKIIPQWCRSIVNIVHVFS